MYIRLSAVSTGATLGLNNPGFDSREWQEIFSFLQRAADVRNANLL